MTNFTSFKHKVIDSLMFPKIITMKTQILQRDQEVDHEVAGSLPSPSSRVSASVSGPSEAALEPSNTVLTLPYHSTPPLPIKTAGPSRKGPHN